MTCSPKPTHKMSTGFRSGHSLGARDKEFKCRDAAGGVVARQQEAHCDLLCRRMQLQAVFSAGRG
jgi:hypothetical protein